MLFTEFYILSRNLKSQNTQYLSGHVTSWNQDSISWPLLWLNLSNYMYMEVVQFQQIFLKGEGACYSSLCSAESNADLRPGADVNILHHEVNLGRES